MGILKVYAEIMDEVPKLKKDYELSYHEAIKKAKEIYKDELEKAQSLATKQGKELIENQINDIITDKEDIDNGQLYDIKTGETTRDLI